MNASERIKIIEDSAENGESKSIRYKNESKVYPVKEIPLNALLYNPYNGRIRSMILSFESSNSRSINNENEEDIKVIEQCLYDSAKAKNDKTLESLREIGQQEVGIVTKDGVIIDGNRRACLLNILHRDNPNINTFKAIVLEDELSKHEKDITLLETRYQMGVDSKVDYNPIEKYIRCEELSDKHNFEISEIADLMAESEQKIQEWLNIFKLMNEYLEYLGTPKLYTRLDKREGHFVDLYGYLNTYNKNRNLSWQYNDSDIIDLKNAYFDYVRLGIPVQRARVIAKPANNNSFFAINSIWNDFLDEHKKVKMSATDLDFYEIKDTFPEKSNEEIIQVIDNKWKKELSDRLIENLSYNEISVKEVNESFLPLKNLKRVRNTLNNINVSIIDSNTIPEVVAIISDIERRVEFLKTEING